MPVESGKIEGEEFDSAFAAFRADFDPRDSKPMGYQVEPSTASGDGL